MPCPARVHPLRKPKNHRVPVPRWHLSLPDSVTHVCTAYIGVQKHTDTPGADGARDEAIAAIQLWLEEGNTGPLAYEMFTVIDGCDVQETTIWVCYWDDKTAYEKSLDQLPLKQTYYRLPDPGRTSIGIWREDFAAEYPRIETNYSGLDYLPGLAKLPSATFPEHTLSAYWGAARDRIPNSAYDLFPPSNHTPPSTAPKGLSQYLIGTNSDNVAHIRSGQFWENCGQEEADSYSTKLEPTLRSGLEYLWENSPETGALGLRYLQNEDPSSPESIPRKESCGAGFFTNLEALETWAKSHKSHLAIYRGALAHYKTFGEDRKFRTWHEVSVLKEGDARFQYMNCVPKTGVISSVTLKVENIEGAP